MAKCDICYTFPCKNGATCLKTGMDKYEVRPGRLNAFFFQPHRDLSYHILLFHITNDIISSLSTLVSISFFKGEGVVGSDERHYLVFGLVYHVKISRPEN